MSRACYLTLAALLSLSACGGAGRCTTNSECPVGASCDASLGVCVVGGASNLSTGSAPDAGSNISSRLPANYAHVCTSDSDCSDVPRTSCGYGMCVTACGGSTQCSPGTTCATGGSAAPICGLSCVSDGDCVTGSKCASGYDPVTHAPAKMCTAPRAPSPIGGTCSDDGDCAGSARCMTSPTRPNFCTMPCTTNAQCGADSVCVGLDANTAGCFALCEAPGTQSTCRSGFRCVGLTGKTYGACMW